MAVKGAWLTSARLREVIHYNVHAISRHIHGSESLVHKVFILYNVSERNFEKRRLHEFVLDSELCRLASWFCQTAIAKGLGQNLAKLR